MNHHEVSSPSTKFVPLVLRDGRVVQEMIRVPAESECCVIDTLRITLHEQTLNCVAGCVLVTDDQIVLEVSKLLQKILGFGISRKLDKGRDFYTDAWELGDNMGHFAMGGSRQNSTFLLAINGRGCLGAAEGWEKRLYDFLTSPLAVQPRITRVDLAHDDFSGSVMTVDDYSQAWYDGGFDRYSNRPEPCQFGPWMNRDPMNKGRTFYVGTKSSSQMFRGYEKGKQLGAPQSPWVRSEVQFSNNDKVIPLDILIDPSSYFVAAYPCLRQFSPSATPKRTELVKANLEANIAHYIRHTKRSYGKFIKLAREIYGDAQLLEMIQAEGDEWPSRLVYPDSRFVPIPIHEQEALQPAVMDYIDFISAAPCFGYRGEKRLSVAS